MPQDAGATAIYSDVGLWEAAIAELTQTVARSLAMRISVSAYLGGSGLAPHNDNQCALVLQIAGVKRWRLWLKASAMLPVGGGSMLFGRTKSRQLELEKLGEVRAPRISFGIPRALSLIPVHFLAMFR